MPPDPEAAYPEPNLPTAANLSRRALAGLAFMALLPSVGAQALYWLREVSVGALAITWTVTCALLSLVVALGRVAGDPK